MNINIEYGMCNCPDPVQLRTVYCALTVLVQIEGEGASFFPLILFSPQSDRVCKPPRQL